MWTFLILSLCFLFRCGFFLLFFLPQVSWWIANTVFSACSFENTVSLVLPPFTSPTLWWVSHVGRCLQRLLEGAKLFSNQREMLCNGFLLYSVSLDCDKSGSQSHSTVTGCWRRPFSSSPCCHSFKVNGKVSLQSRWEKRLFSEVNLWTFLKAPEYVQESFL